MLSQAQREAVAERLRSGRLPGAAWRIPRRDPGGQDPPASFGQEQLWFLDQFAPGQAVYNVPVVIRISGHLDQGALSRALDRLVERHEALRTRLVPDARSRPVQVIDPPRPLRLNTAAVTGFEPAQLRALINAEAMRPFDLGAAPLLRTWLARLGGAEHALVVVVHHAVFDGWSAKVLLHDLAALYRSEVTGESSGLAELPVQFADYAVWERQRLRGEALAGLERYWRDTLAGAETVEFPADRPRPAVDSPEGALAERMADAGLLAGLRELSRRQGVTMFVTVLASLLALLHRYTGQDDLVVGTASANRGHAALQPLIGFLVNTLPIRCDLSGDPPFTDLLARVKGAVLGAFAHQDLPFGKLVDTLGVPRDASRNPVLQINMTYAERDDAPVPAAGAQFAASDLVVGTAAAKFDLNFAVETRPGGLWTECCYKTALFDARTIERLLGHWEMLLRGVAADSSARLSQFPLLTPAELRAELSEWNDTDGPVPQACAHELFQAQAIRTPDAVAVQWGAAQHDGDWVSYAELNRQANQIARRLRELGVGPERLVGVCMRTGLRRLAALLGVWKAGGGYVPLDPALPAGRLSFMIADADLRLILTDTASEPAVAAAGVAPICVDDEWQQTAGLDGSDLAGTGVTPASVAYVIYTSGSTGLPKGVLIEHRNLVNLLHGMAAHAGKHWGMPWAAGPGPVMLGYHSYAFDMSVLDMYLPLATGGTLVLVPPQTASSPRRLAQLICRARVTFAFLTPAVLDLLPAGEYPDLRVLMTAGDEHPAELARRWVRPGLLLGNGYGPTETTVVCSYAEIGDATQSPLPFAPPVLPNYQMYVLDRHLNPVPAGVIGELHIGGVGVARGYLNRPELTAERFIPDPFRPGPGNRLYKSGDLVRRRPDGSIVFCGRIDNQVKIRGVRVELGEVEAALTAHPAVAGAVVTVTAAPAGGKELAAYLRPSPGASTLSDEDVRAHLARTLPSAMIPAHLITVGQFPLNNNGKVDKKALPPPAGRHGAGQEAPATPAEATLAGIYATLLGTACGATDSFFDLGGNSLTAMRLVDMIGNETGADISVTEVFLRPSPRQLAAAIDSTRSGTGPSGTRPGLPTRPLIELTSAAAGPPMFLIHAVGGTVSAYAQLGEHLGGTFRVYGLEAPGLSDPAALATSLACLADDYTRRIRAAQPAGPYRLAGWSMGGVIAFEVAQRLELAGLQVGLLVLLDAPFAVPADYVPGEPELAARFVADVGNSLGLDISAAPDPAVTARAGQIAWLAQLVSSRNGGAGNGGAGNGVGQRDAMGAALAQRFGLFAAHSQMIAGYQPAAPRVRAPTLIVSAAASLNARARLTWPRMLTGPVSVLSVDSDHYAFLRPPLVADVGAAIRAWHAKHGEGCADGS